MPTMKAKDKSKVQMIFREQVHFYLTDYQTPLGKTVDIIIIFMNFLICAIFVIDTYPISDELRSFLWNIEVVTVFLFILEYLAWLYGSTHRFRHLVRIYSIIDLVAILPTLFQLILPAFGISVNINFLKTIRIFKVFRIFRFVRFFEDPHFFFGSISLEVLRLARLVMIILMLFFVSSGLFFYVENPVNSQVQNFGNAFYFIVVALTTVGFGDIVPVSEAGRWVTVLAIVSGIILIPWQASQIVKEWAQYSKKADVTCSQCGWDKHDIDAYYCKHCGNDLYKPPTSDVQDEDRKQQ